MNGTLAAGSKAAGGRSSRALPATWEIGVYLCGQSGAMEGWYSGGETQPCPVFNDGCGRCGWRSWETSEDKTW